MADDNTPENSGYHALATLLESIEVGLVVIDLDYRVKVWNGFMENHSGMTANRIQNQSLFEAFPDLPKTWLTRKVQSVVTLNTRTFTSWEQRPYLFRFRNTRPVTGTEEFMFQNLTISPLTGTGGQVEQVCLMIYDVTDVASGRRALEHANEQLERLSSTDRLTGLLNRGTWENLLDAEFERYRRYGHNTVLVMFDIDHFKQVNDTYGHLIGDEVIREVARITREALRQADRPGRYGGEEFGIILPETDIDGALVICERIRETLATTVIHTDDGDIRCTVSMGLVQLTDEPENYMQWLQQADDALYQAKEGGRNRSVAIRP
ncbi:diguanylate cyclase (GGDEF) domain-containing protein [Marinobacter daqiaonensis]|uniref:diguanylate cyclase n=1 Tax=Marinobacter daqiaonensis TaxID=650891 RepID=A0A1I6JEB5_9GAMM|nr:sensor domain-containing diguanylate cyclase [Marinobacter daqiaonensis]SFR77272.1 diguanylate cyclase (GGDEF) domain-containing protein [Marinobacter daqiaonensis]